MATRGRRKVARKPGSIDLTRTLGPLVVEWIESELVHGPGDVEGQRIELDDERVRFLLHAYRIDERGRRIIRRAVLSRAKGWAKSEFAAMIAAAEALGPVRFAGWGHDGRPLGRPQRAPYIPLVATEEGQSGNTYAAAEYMLRYGRISRLARQGLDVGMTRTFVPGGGKIVALTAKASSKEGGKETFAVFDEALALDTPIPTPAGWSTMGELEVGDLVFGSDGHPRAVVKVTDVLVERECYRVRFGDGTAIVASGGHLWNTKIASSTAQPRIRTTAEMHADGRRFRVPRAQPALTPEMELPIDPYVLGYWLGDGDARNATISVDARDIADVERAITDRGYTTTRCATRDRAPMVYVSLPDAGRGSHGSGLKGRLREAGLLENKHVPDAYLRASRAQRLELVRGLMDSDGSASPTGACAFANTNRRIVDAFVELLRSLGQDPRVRYQADARAREGGYWRVTFTPYGLAPFALPRKVARCRERGGAEAEWLSIVSIEPIEPVPVRCIAVEAADGLFLAGAGWNVTHNTHLYVTDELRRLHSTIRRNLAKRRAAEPWSLETTTMYAPGESSIAESSHRYWEAIVAGAIRDEGLLFDHRQGPRSFDWDDDDELRAALVEAYGEAAEWMDFERLVAEARDPDTDAADFRRYFLNQPTERTAGKWITDERWRECRSELEIPDGAELVLGVDAAKTRDCSSCTWSWKDPESGRIIQRWRVWSARRSNAHHVFVPGGRIDNDEIADWISEELMERFQVRLLFYDERYFDTQANDLSKLGLTVVEMHQGATQMYAAWDRYYDLVHMGPEPRIGHDDDPVVAAHVRAALGRRTGSRTRNWHVEKAGDHSIDALASAVMSAYGAEHLEEFLVSEPGVLLR